MDKLIWSLWIALLAAVASLLLFDESRQVFTHATQAHPLLLGALKFTLLGTMGELLGGRIASGAWRFKGIHLAERALVWAVLGVALSLVFPLFSAGTDSLLQQGLLPGKEYSFFHAFWKSLLMNLLFGFEMMVFHRVTDTLNDRGGLFSVWPVSKIMAEMDWRNMFRVVGLSVLWFWVPAHTLTFMLPANYRVLAAAGLGVALGTILGFAKRRAVRTAAND